MKNIKKISEFKSKLKEEEIFADCLLFIDNEQFDKAVNCFDEIIEKSPDNLNAMFGKALSLDKCNEWGKAIQLLNIGLNIEPHNVHGLIIKAIIMRRNGKLELALKCYDRLIEISPGGVATPIHDTLIERKGSFSRIVASLLHTKMLYSVPRFWSSISL